MSKTSDNPHYYLSLNDYCLSKKESERKLKQLMNDIGLPTHALKMTTDIEIKREDTVARKVKYYALLNEFRKSGCIKEFQDDIDRKHSVWGGTFELSTNMKNAKIKIQYAGYEKEVISPARTIPIELDLADDILEYRKLACELSNENNFIQTCRYYRAYILSCTALVEAYINRYILLLKYKGCNNSDFEELNNEEKRIPIENRLELLFKIVTGNGPNILKSGKQWSDFKKIKNTRNILIHSLEPYYGIEIKKLAYELNLVKDGVGGLLELFEFNQGQKTVSFISKLKYAAEVSYNSK